MKITRRPPFSREPIVEMVRHTPVHQTSFADLMTNILCFFILLSAFSKERMMGFISDGLGSFRESVLAHGLPGVLPSDRLPMDLGADRVLFCPPRSVLPSLLVEDDGRITDANRDALREVVVESMKLPQSVTLPVPLLFSPAQSELTDAHRTALRELAIHLRSGNGEIRVEAYSWEEGKGQDGWKIALDRAENVARYLTFVGPMRPDRISPLAYGPPPSRRETDGRQERWGRRVVLLTLVVPMR